MADPNVPPSGSDLPPPPLVGGQASGATPAGGGDQPPPTPGKRSRSTAVSDIGNRTRSKSGESATSREPSQPSAEGGAKKKKGGSKKNPDGTPATPGGTVAAGPGATPAGGGAPPAGSVGPAGGAAGAVPPVVEAPRSDAEATNTAATPATATAAGATAQGAPQNDDVLRNPALSDFSPAQLATVRTILQLALAPPGAPREPAPTAAASTNRETAAERTVIDVDQAAGTPAVVDEDLATLSDRLDVLATSGKTTPGEFRSQMLQRLNSLLTNYGPQVGWRLGGGFSLSERFDEVLVILRNPALSPEDAQARLATWWRNYRRVLALIVTEAILPMTLYEVLQNVQPPENWEAGNGLPGDLALDAIGRLEWVLRTAPRMLRAEADKAAFTVTVPVHFRRHGHAVFGNRDLTLASDVPQRARSRSRSREREPYESRFCSPVALRPHFLLFGQILFALHELPKEIYADLRTLIVEGDKLQRWGTSLRWRREVILTGPSNAQRLAAVVVVDEFTRHVTRPAQHPAHLDQDVLAEFAAIYMIVHRRSTATLRQYLIMGKECRHMSDIRGVSGLYDPTARASSYVSLALAQYMPAQHAVAAGWTLEEVAGESLTECDYRNLTLAPPSPTAAGLRTIPAAPQAFSTVGSIHPSESASVRAPRPAAGGRGSGSTVAAPRDHRVWRVGQPCPPIAPGETPSGGGHLSVRGLCGRCCKPGHRMAACNNAHRDFNPAQPFALLNECARGERLVGGDPA